MKPIQIQKRQKPLNPAFKRFQNLPLILASQPAGFAIPPAVLAVCPVPAALPAATPHIGQLVMMHNE